MPFILVQTDLKRLLAYHSVEHIGLIATAIGLGGPLGLYAGLLHLFNHAMAKALLFFVAGNLSQRYGTTQMSRIRNADPGDAGHRAAAAPGDLRHHRGAALRHLRDGVRHRRGRLRPGQSGGRDRR